MSTSGLDAGLRFAQLCDALGHPARVILVRYLSARRQPATLAELHAQLPLAQSTVSQHVAVLVGSALVRRERRRPRTFYRLDAAVLEEFRRAAAAL